MALHLQCKLCTHELDHSGALLFSPPDILERVKKFHICQHCYTKIVTSSPELGMSEMPHGRRSAR